MNGGKRPRAPPGGPARVAASNRGKASGPCTAPARHDARGDGVHHQVSRREKESRHAHGQPDPNPLHHPLDLGAVLVIDAAAANAPRRCATDDGVLADLRVRPAPARRSARPSGGGREHRTRPPPFTANPRGGRCDPASAIT